MGRTGVHARKASSRKEMADRAKTLMSVLDLECANTRVATHGAHSSAHVMKDIRLLLTAGRVMMWMSVVQQLNLVRTCVWEFVKTHMDHLFAPVLLATRWQVTGAPAKT